MAACSGRPWATDWPKPGKLREARRKASWSLVKMVAVLWDKGAKDPALRLEAPWNYALRDSAFHLHCTYPRWGFINADDEAAVCPAHSHLVVQSWLRQ
jgi:hypothetical protein